MKRYIIKTLMGMAVVIGSAHGMDTKDQETISGLHKKLDTLIIAGNNQITVHTLANNHTKQLNQEEAHQFNTNFLSTLNSVKQHDDGSIEMINCFSQTDAPPTLSLKASPRPTMPPQLQTTSKLFNLIVPTTACVACLSLAYLIGKHQGSSE